MVRAALAQAYQPGPGCVAGLPSGRCGHALSPDSLRFCPAHARCLECEHPNSHYRGCPKTE